PRARSGGVRCRRAGRDRPAAPGSAPPRGEDRSMCRLLAYASRTPVTLSDLLGTDELAEFTDLSRKHADGWGFAWAEQQGVATIAAARTADPADALAETAALVAVTMPFSSLNAMLITDRELVALSRYRPEAEALEAEHEYYHMRYRVTPDAVIVASSGWGHGW